MSYYDSAALNGYGDFYDSAAMDGYGDFYDSAAMDGYGMKLTKGSPAAKKYMAYLRSLRGTKTRKTMKKTKGGLLISGILGALAIKKAIDAAKAKKALAAAQKGKGGRTLGRGSLPKERWAALSKHQIPEDKLEMLREIIERKKAEAKPLTFY